MNVPLLLYTWTLESEQLIKAMAAPQNNQGQLSMPKASYNFCLPVNSFAIQQVALVPTLQPPFLSLGHAFLTRSHKMPDRSLSTHLPGMQHETPQHRCPPLPTECHPWLEPMAPHCLMGKSLLPTSLGAYCQDNAVIPRASGMHARMHAASHAQCSQCLPVPPVPQVPYGSQHLAARRAPPSMKLAVGTAGREAPPLPPHWLPPNSDLNIAF